MCNSVTCGCRKIEQDEGIFSTRRFNDDQNTGQQNRQQHTLFTTVIGQRMDVRDQLIQQTQMMINETPW